jgi:hypothetical protein
MGSNRRRECVLKKRTRRAAKGAWQGALLCTDRCPWFGGSVQGRRTGPQPLGMLNPKRTSCAPGVESIKIGPEQMQGRATKSVRNAPGLLLI